MRTAGSFKSNQSLTIFELKLPNCFLGHVHTCEENLRFSGYSRTILLEIVVHLLLFDIARHVAFTQTTVVCYIYCGIFLVMHLTNYIYSLVSYTDQSDQKKIAKCL